MSVVIKVVTVFAMSCQVSENPKIGPVTSQPAMSATAAMKAHGEPAMTETRWLKSENQCAMPRGGSFSPTESACFCRISDRATQLVGAIRVPRDQASRVRFVLAGQLGS